MHITNKLYTVELVRNNRNYLFIFGDNDIKRGLGGQAIIRNEKNTIGIPTKKYPSTKAYAYYNDSEYEDNCNKIRASINKIVELSSQYDKVIYPSSGVGTGLSKLDIVAPRTYKFLLEQIEYLKTNV